MSTLDEIQHLAQQHGLVVRGGFVVGEADNVPGIDVGIATVTLVLFGNVGSSLWKCFSDSAEYTDGLPDPMNRWSERIGGQIARQLSGRALFPFGDPPYQPFIAWAQKIESLRCSKIGLLIHPQYGLWHAYRFAIALPEQVSGLDAVRILDQLVGDNICQNCVDQPCLSACPVGAFTVSGYNVAGCYDFLKHSDTESGDCRKVGCQSRLACPQGHEFRYHTEHTRFHMDALFDDLSNRLEN